MILEQETFDKFGYYSGQLKKGSHRPVVRKCDTCGKIGYPRFIRITPYCRGCGVSVNSVNIAKAASNRLKKMWEIKDVRFSIHHAITDPEVRRKTNEKISQTKRGIPSRNKYSYNYIKSTINMENYKLLSKKYKEAHALLRLQCPQNHIFSMKWNSFQQGQRCPRCAHVSSKGELQVLDFIKELGLKAQSRNRIAIRPQELDIYIPDKKIAIEYCGLYWHSEDKKGKNYHRDKHLKCKQAGIYLIQVFEDEWINKKNIVKSRLKNILGMTTNKIYARKCDLKLVSNCDALSFCQENHLQGRGQIKIAYGLYYDDKLVSVMTFSKVSLAKGSKSHDDWEISRFCSIPEVNIVGGASRLFSAFIKYNYPKKVISFCDVRWGNGKVYEKMGMILDEKITQPNYFYVVDGARKHRFSYRKDRLVQNGADFKKTERQITEEVGLFRIYDCGHQKWTWMVKE